MQLFSKDKINITRIHAINKYTVTEEDIKKSSISHHGTASKTYQLIFFVSGESDTHFCGVDIKDCPNSVRYLPKIDYEGEYTVKTYKPGYCIDIYFDTNDEMPCFATGLLDMAILKEKFIRIYHIWNEKKSDYYIKSMLLFYEIILIIRKHANTLYISSEQRSGLEKAYLYMAENFKSQNFDYKKLCEASGFSYSYFSTLFIKKYRMSPVKYVTKMKIDYAKELLVDNRYTISQIAELCGFENVYYFSNVFKKIVGVSPNKYKPI